MSQSTVTARLQRLERELGYTLFERLQSGVRLTREGRRLLPLAEQLVRLEGQMMAPEDVGVPTLRIMSGRAFVSTDVPTCLARMMKRVKVQFEVRMGLYDEMVEALLTNQVDFCFLGEPVYHPNVKRIDFPPDRIDLIVPKDHHFVHHFPGVTALRTEPFIAFSRPTAPLHRRIVALLAEAEVYPNVRMALDSIDGIKAMVSHGLGVSILPRRTLHDADTKGYHVIPLQGAGWERPTLLACPDSVYELPIAKTFIEVVETYYSET